MKAAMALLIGALLAGAALGADGQPTEAKHKLPAGFAAVEGSGVDKSGWPKEIRCEKDGSVMVFVPAGEHRTGLSAEQLKELARLELALEGDKFEKAAPLTVKKWFVASLWFCDMVEAEGESVNMEMELASPVQIEFEVNELDLKQVREMLIMLLAEFGGMDLTKEEKKQWEAAGGTVEALKEIPRVRETVEKAEQALTPLTEEELKKMELEELATTWELRRLERKHKEITKAEMERWKQDGGTWEGLLKIPAVAEDLKKTGMGGDWIEKYRQHVSPEGRIAERATRLGEDFGTAKKTQVGAFYIDKCEVTNEQYRRFVAEVKDEKHVPGIAGGPSYNLFRSGPIKVTYKLWDDKKRNHDKQPVTCVSEKDAAAYAKWAGKTVPMRVEWERAATGEGDRLFPWGSEFEASMCRSSVAKRGAEGGENAEMPKGKVGAAIELYGMIREARNATVPSEVGTFAKDVSPFGVMDMAGNVSEWVREGTRKYGTAGGNSSTLILSWLVPARADESFIGSYKVLGFRTVLEVEEGK